MSGRRRVGVGIGGLNPREIAGFGGEYTVGLARIRQKGGYQGLRTGQRRPWSATSLRRGG